MNMRSMKGNGAVPLSGISRVFALALLFLGGCGDREKDKAKDGADPEAKEAPAEAGHAVNLVTLSPESLKNMDLGTEPVRIGSLDIRLAVPGRIEADANRTAKVTAMLEGRIVRLDGDVGDKVAQGQVLGFVESPELLDKALALKAPVSGILMERSAAVGELVEKGRPVFSIGDPRFLWLIGEVREKDIASVRSGQKVGFTVPAYPGECFQGKVARLGGVVESASRTFEVRIELGNRDGRLKPGMFADMRITTGTLRDALLVPDAALQSDGEDRIVFIALDAHRFEKRTVRTGLAADGMVQILEGLKAGESAVTEGGFTLKSELLKGELGEE